MTIAVERLEHRAELLDRGWCTRCSAGGGEEHPAGAAPSYAELAVECGLPVTQVTNHLHWARRQYRRLILERLRDLTLDEREFHGEARRLLGRDGG